MNLIEYLTDILHYSFINGFASWTEPISPNRKNVILSIFILFNTNHMP